MPEKTKRQQIIEVLRREEHTARELATILELPLSRLISELEHVGRSYRRELKLRPAVCRACGFSFARRAKLSAPSRCPKCRSEWTEGPFISLRSDG